MKKVSFFRSIQLKFIVIYILLLLMAIQIIGSYFVRELETELLENFKQSVNDRVDLMNYNLTQTFNRERDEDVAASDLQDEIQNIISDIDTRTITTLQVVNEQSRILATNDYARRDIIGKKSTRDIILKAILFATPYDDIELNLANEHLFYIKADPIFDSDHNVVGVVYIEASLSGVYAQLQNVNRIFWQGSLLALTVSAIIGILVARAITKPIMEMRKQAQTMARGDFSQKVKIYGTDEISHLAEAFNYLNDRLKLSMATIEKEQRKLSSVLENMSEGVIATDQTGKVTLINDAAGKLIGKSPHELLGKHLLDFLTFDEKIINITDLQYSSSMIIDLNRDETVYLRASLSTTFDEYERITGFIIVLRDVTEQEKVEQERREFVSNVSHELRTPLTTMKSYLEVLSDGTWKDEELAPRFLEVVQKETERMIRLVNDLLQLSRMDNKEYSFQRKRVDFIEYFHRVIDRLEMNLTESIIFKRNLPKDKYYVWIDEDRMTQILDNIISNAIKYSPEGGTITFHVETYKNNLLVRIKDEGIGIPYEMRDKIFDRFYRADKARSRKLGGSGLGLAIAKELVEAHYGKIWADSTEGKGTTILFTLPLMGKKRREVKK